LTSQIRSWVTRHLITTGESLAFVGISILTRP
jgi:hypothetical protein